jgi:hypothetical protein
MFHIHFHFMLLLPEEQMGETWGPSQKQCSFENGTELDGKVFSLVSVFEKLNNCGPVGELQTNTRN